MFSPTREGFESLLSENHALKEEIARLRAAMEDARVTISRVLPDRVMIGTGAESIYHAFHTLDIALKGGQGD